MDRNENHAPAESQPPRRKAVVAVVMDLERYLVIKRSEHVVAPGQYCFPGGMIEDGESEQVAIAREMLEELGIRAEALQCLARTVTPWDVEVAWWQTKIEPNVDFRVNEREVAELVWMTRDELLARKDLLESNRSFLEGCPSCPSPWPSPQRPQRGEGT